MKNIELGLTAILNTRYTLSCIFLCLIFADLLCRLMSVEYFLSRIGIHYDMVFKNGRVLKT